MDANIWGRIPIEVWFIIKEKLIENLKKKKKLKPGVILYYDNKCFSGHVSSSYHCRPCSRNMQAYSHYCNFCDIKLSFKNDLVVKRRNIPNSYDTLCKACKKDCTKTYDRCRHLEIYLENNVNSKKRMSHGSC